MLTLNLGPSPLSLMRRDDKVEPGSTLPFSSLPCNLSYCRSSPALFFPSLASPATAAPHLPFSSPPLHPQLLPPLRDPLLDPPRHRYSHTRIAASGVRRGRSSRSGDVGAGEEGEEDGVDLTEAKGLIRSLTSGADLRCSPEKAGRERRGVEVGLR